MKRRFQAGIQLCGMLLATSIAQAHFGMVIPSSNIVDQDNRQIEMDLSFSHPFEGIGMDLRRPQKAFVLHEGEKTDLLPSLKATSIMDHSGWHLRYKVQRPGVYQFVMEPQPYWEPAEDLYIIHYTKALVAAYGDDQGWDQPAGLPTEIVPLLRPFGNYAGNTFTGKVLIDGQPAPNSEVEVELYNQNGATAPSDYHITQVVKTDDNGVFNFTCPTSGWWGFSALHEADYTMTGPNGSEKNVELGGVLWVYFDDIQ